MRVAFVSQPFDNIIPPVEVGSIGIWTYQVMRALADRELEFVVYSKRFADQPLVEHYDGVEYRRVSVPSLLDETAARPFKLAEKLLRYPWPKRPFFSTVGSNLAYIWRVASDLRSQQIDIVHVHNFTQFVPVIRSLNPRVKIVLHMQCEWLSQLDRAMIEPRIREADRVIGCSQHVIDLVSQRFPEYAERCQVVYNGVDPKIFSGSSGSQPEQPGSPKRLLFVGRVSPEKGIHVLLEAFNEVLEEYPDVQLDIVGPPAGAPYEYIVMISDDPLVRDLARFYHGHLMKENYLQDLQALIPDKNKSKVNFVGGVDHSKVVNYFQRADVLINPSLSEAFGMSLVEAMGNRKPVIATRVGGMKEIVLEGETGLFAEPDDPQSLAQAILKLLKDDDLRKAMGEAGFRRVGEHFSWERVAGALWEGYLSI
jgi:spore coat protein SA